MAAIVDYLAPGNTDRNEGGAPSGNDHGAAGEGAEGPSSYYADGGDGPGRWLGTQAEANGLVGIVDREDFAKVLAGRDPHTGERLITAQGSAGRRDTLGSGRESRRDATGRPLYDAHDAAAVLKVSVAEATRLMEVGSILAIAGLGGPGQKRDVSGQVTGPGPGDGTGRPGPSRPGRDSRPGGPGTVPVDGDPVPLAGNDSRDGECPVPGDGGPVPGGGGGVPVQPEGSYLVPVIGRDGQMWVTDTELSRCEDARATGPDPDVIARAGEPGDDLSLPEAARLVGVTARYLRRLAKRWETDQRDIVASLAEGRTPHQAWVRAHRGTRGRWFIRRADLVEFVQRRRPPAVRVGFDLTLTTEKSLSVLALLGSDETRAAVLGAIQAGNDTALGWFEQRAATTRVRGETVDGAGWTVASFQHLTSRALDPFAHHHNVVSNSVVGPDGQHRALDARDLYRNAAGASAIATVEMRHRLRSLGVRWRHRPGATVGSRGSWEIDGIDDDVLREFSRRRTEIEDALTELEEAIGRGAQPDEVGHVVLKTRPPKQRVPVDDLVEEWRSRAADLGLTTRRLKAVTGHSAAEIEVVDGEVFAALSGPAGVCATTSVFDRNELLVTLAHIPIPNGDGDLQPLAVPGVELEALADRYLASEHVVPIPDLDGNPTLFTTTMALEVQSRIIDCHSSGIAHSFGRVDIEHLAAALDRHPKLSDEQRVLVKSFCTSGDSVQCAIGRAGAGKTTAMAAAVDAWQTAGYRVLGAAVKGEAARTLQAAAGINCETVAWILAHTDPYESPLDARTVLIVDEASTIADHDLDRLMAMADRAGATLRLIGDPAQHGAVTAGGMFRVLCERDTGHTPELTEHHRLQDPADQAAADALRDGRISEALDTLDAAGHLHVASDDLDIYVQMLTRWWNAHQTGEDHPMVDRRNVTRHQLNQLAHRLRQANGEVGTDEITTTDGRRFAVGDHVTARTPARDLHPPERPSDYIRNGAHGTVTAIHQDRNRQRDRVTVEFETIGQIDLPRQFIEANEGPTGHPQVGLDLAYALTSYAVQGATFDTSTSRIDEGANRPEAYVDVSRGRHSNHLYLTRATDPLDGEHLPKAPPMPLAASITDRLGRSGPQPTAWELLNQNAGAGPDDPGPEPPTPERPPLAM